MWIRAGDRQYDLDAIRSGDFHKTDSIASTALRFCYDWLNGKETFSISTSGSTGNPKEVKFSGEQLEASARQTQKAIGLQPGYNALLCLHPNFIAGQMVMVRCLVTGMNLVVAEPSANPYQGINVRIDYASMVPYQVDHILQSPQAQRLDEIKCALIGGAPISYELECRINQLKGKWFATYGMTETISHVALRELSGTHPQKAFQVLPDINISVDDRSCLEIQANYLGNEKVITNDLVKIESPKEFIWLGRYDNVINSGGYKIIPEKVEKALEPWLSSQEITNRFFVGPISHSQLGEQAVLVVEGEPFDRERLDNLKSWMKANFQAYDIPKEIFFIKEFEETPTGKVNRKASISLLPARQ